jgi:sulfite reductase alpha subunit-like flavoprotein
MDGPFSEQDGDLWRLIGAEARVFRCGGIRTSVADVSRALPSS